MYCPRCDKQGKILKRRVRAMGKIVVLWECDECDASWEDPRSISKANFGQFFEQLLEEKYGIDIFNAEMATLGDFWLIWYDKATQKFVAKAKLGIRFEELRYFNEQRGLETEVSIEGVLLDDLIEAFGGVKMKGLPTLGLYSGVSILNPEIANIFQPCAETKIDLSKYYYFVEFDSEVDGKITAESENYPAIFVPRQPSGFFDET